MQRKKTSMITISIDDEVNTHSEAEMLLEEVIRQVRNGNTSGVYPNWSLDGEEEPEEGCYKHYFKKKKKGTK